MREKVFCYVLGLLVWAGGLVMQANAEGMTREEAEALYQEAKYNIHELDFHDPYYDEMQILHDEEHGTTGTEQLFVFDQILKAEGRTEQTDIEILVPWLVQYLWTVPDSLYSQGAVRLLHDLQLDEAFYEVLVSDLLQTHPHGAVRAAVLEASSDYRPWLEDEAIVKLMKRLALTDPHPDVRGNALGWLFDAKFTEEQVIRALAQDPAAEIRVLWAGWVASTLEDPKRSEPYLRKALFAPENRNVAQEMMERYMRSGPVWSDFQRMSQALNFWAKYPKAIRDTSAFGWQIQSGAAPMLARGAPFNDGAALEAWMQQAWIDTATPLEDRSLILRTLLRDDNAQIDVQDLADFLLDPGHDEYSLSPLFELSLGSRALGRLFTTWPQSQVSQARNQKELVIRVMEFMSEPGPDGEPRAHGLTQDGMLHEFIEIMRSLPEKHSQWLMRRVLNFAKESPLDLTYGVSELLESRELIDDKAFLDFARAKDGADISSVSDIFVDRLRPGAWEDPEPMPGDLTLAAQLIEIAEEANPGNPKEAYQDVYDLIYGLSRKGELPASLPDLDVFETKLRALRDQGEDPKEFWAINYWLGED